MTSKGNTNWFVKHLMNGTWGGVWGGEMVEW